jgi:D-lactate dehydrogenase
VGRHIKAYDVAPDLSWSRPLGVTYCASLDETVRDVDILSLHCPLLPATFHLINEHLLMHVLTRAIVLVNTSRGELVHTEALLKALQSDRVMTAGLDVLERERDPLRGLPVSGHAKEVVDHPNVVYSPHIAYFTREAFTDIWSTTASNMTKFAKKECIQPSFIRA